MIDHLTDTNVFSEIFKGRADVEKFVGSFENSLDTTVYIECLQGSKGNQEKLIIKNAFHISRFFITLQVLMKRRMRRALGRKIKDDELTSLNSRIEVREKEERGKVPPS